MKIPPGFGPSKVCSRSKDEVLAAPAFSDPYLQRDDAGTPWLIAANPFSVLAVRAEEAQDDVDGAIPLDATSAAEKHQDDDWNPAIACGEKDVVVQLTRDTPHLTLIAPRPEVFFPPILQSIATAARKPDESPLIALNVRLLSRLAKGMGVETVTIRRVSHGATYWLVVQPVTSVGTPVIGLLQPLGNEAEARPDEAPVMGGARTKAPAPAESSTSPVCSACGKAVSTTVSIQTSTGDPTPPVCQECFGNALSEVKGAKKARKGAAS